MENVHNKCSNSIKYLVSEHNLIYLSAVGGRWVEVWAGERWLCRRKLWARWCEAAEATDVSQRDEELKVRKGMEEYIARVSRRLIQFIVET